jgi:hypothetical protein
MNGASAPSGRCRALEGYGLQPVHLMNSMNGASAPEGPRLPQVRVSGPGKPQTSTSRCHPERAQRVEGPAFHSVPASMLGAPGPCVRTLGNHKPQPVNVIPSERSESRDLRFIASQPRCWVPQVRVFGPGKAQPSTTHCHLERAKRVERPAFHSVPASMLGAPGLAFETWETTEL